MCLLGLTVQKSSLTPWQSERARLRALAELRIAAGALCQIERIVKVLVLVAPYSNPRCFSRGASALIAAAAGGRFFRLARFLPRMLLRRTYLGCPLLVVPSGARGDVEYLHPACQCCHRIAPTLPVPGPRASYAAPPPLTQQGVRVGARRVQWAGRTRRGGDPLQLGPTLVPAWAATPASRYSGRPFGVHPAMDDVISGALLIPWLLMHTGDNVAF